MPIYAKQSNIWYRGNSPTSNQIYAKWGGWWYPASFIYAKWGGGWYGTGYVGRPQAPQNFQITSGGDNFNWVSLAYWGPPAGSPWPDYYIVRMYNYYDQLLAEDRSDQPGWPYYATHHGGSYFVINQDTAYIFRVFSVNSAGESPAAGPIRYAIGHVQQTGQQAVYGWGGDYDSHPVVNDWSTNDPNHPPNNAVDFPSPSWPQTTWLSLPRGSPGYFEALRLQLSTQSWETRLSRVRMWLTWGRRLWVSVYIHGLGWLGGTNYPATNGGFWYDAPSRANYMHDYCHLSGVGVPANQEYSYNFLAEQGEYKAAQVFVLDLAIDQLDYVAGGYRGGFVECIFTLQDWGIQYYQTVVTVDQQNNYYW